MKKKNSKKGTSRRRHARRGRRVSGFAGGIPMETLAGIGAGAVASKALNGVLKNIKFVNDKKMVRPAIKLGLGYFVSGYKGGGEFVQNIGLGMLAEGSLDLLAAVAPNVFGKEGEQVGAIHGNTVIDLDSVSGYDNLDTAVAGYDDDITVL